MGFNTVAFVMNDLMGDLERSPSGAIYLLTHPVFTPDQSQRVRKYANEISIESGERPLHPQALEVLPTFHADETRYYQAGGNRISQLKVHKTTKVLVNGVKKKAIVLLLEA